MKNVAATAGTASGPSEQDNPRYTRLTMTTVTFVCVHNAQRSQMGEAFFNRAAPEGRRALSAGTDPEARGTPVTVAAMAEVGIDMSGMRPKLLTPEIVAETDLMITMGCGVDTSCPVLLGVRVDEDWALDNPAGQPIEFVRRVRDQIQERVGDLIDRLSQG